MADEPLLEWVMSVGQKHGFTSGAQVADETIDVGGLVEKAGVKPPSFDTPPSDDPAVQFLADTEKDLAKAKKYVDYIAKALDYAEKSGDYTGLENLSTASKQIGVITKRVSSAVGKAKDTVGKVKKIADWLVSMRDFVQATDALDPEERDSFKHWVDTIERVYDTSAALVDWSKMINAAAAGSYAAGVTFFAAAFYGSLFYVAIETLKKGIENSDAYFTRMHRIIEESERDASGRPPKDLGPKPMYPGDYMTPEEEALLAAEQAEHERERAKQDARRREIQAAVEEFDEKVFPGVYENGRRALKDRILAELRKQGSQAAGEWWDCMIAADTGPVTDEPEPLTGGRFWDEQAGMDVYPRKESASAAEMRQEISQFQGVRPPCPFFQELYERERKKHVEEKASGAKQ